VTSPVYPELTPFAEPRFVPGSLGEFCFVSKSHLDQTCLAFIASLPNRRLIDGNAALKKWTHLNQCQK
jgi:hypothetical protein